MGLTVKKLNPKNVNYNIRGSGLIYVQDPICTKDSCIPKPNATPTSPVPVRICKKALTPITATKVATDSNMWELNGVTYKNFNSLWVNIPRNQYTVLKNG